MSYLFCIAMFIAGCVLKDVDLIMASGIFAIAGSIETLAGSLKQKPEK